MYKNGLKYVHQLFENEKYKTDIQVWEEYGLSKLRFNSLKAAMPADWKTYFYSTSKSVFFPLALHTFDMCLAIRNKNVSKIVYQFLAEDITLVHQKYIKWRRDLGDYGDSLYEFRNVFKDLYKVTNVAKFRSFQYRTVQQSLVTNIHLYKWGMIDSDHCDFCKKESETFLHMLYYCEKVQKLWEQVVEYMVKRFNIRIVLNPSNVVYNKLVENAGHVVNFICLITKQFIYSQ